MPEVDFKNVGFLFKFWCRIFIFIEHVLPFSILRKTLFKKTKQFSDKWVLINLLFSIVTMCFIHYGIFISATKFLLYYSFVRVLEIVIYQFNVLIFHPYYVLVIQKRQVYRLINPYRSVVLLGHNLLEVVFWFTAMTGFYMPTSQRLLIKIMDNTIRIFTLNYEKVVDQGEILQLIFFFEVLCGLILTIISLAKFIGELPHMYIRKNKRS